MDLFLTFSVFSIVAAVLFPFLLIKMSAPWVADLERRKADLERRKVELEVRLKAQNKAEEVAHAMNGGI